MHNIMIWRLQLQFGSLFRIKNKPRKSYNLGRLIHFLWNLANSFLPLNSKLPFLKWTLSIEHFYFIKISYFTLYLSTYRNCRKCKLKIWSILIMIWLQSIIAFSFKVELLYQYRGNALICTIDFISNFISTNSSKPRS